MMVYTILFGDGFSLQSKAQEREFNIGRAACPTVATPSRTFLDKAWTDKLSVLRFFETLRSYGSNLAASDRSCERCGNKLGMFKTERCEVLGTLAGSTFGDDAFSPQNKRTNLSGNSLLNAMISLPIIPKK